MKTNIFRIPEIPNDKVILLNITKSYYADKNTPPMFIRENLYEMTRKFWEVNRNNADQADYAIGVANGKVVSVYTDLHWENITCPFKPEKHFKAFSGRPVKDSPYMGVDLSKYMSIRNPFRYVNIELQ